LPKYDENVAGHFYHLYEFLEQASRKLDIFLIIEKGNAKKIRDLNFNMKRIYIQKFRFLPLRFLENFLIVLWARILGYKNFYTHYCYIGGINSGIISKLFCGKSYYWHCEMLWELKQKIFSKIGFNLSLRLSHFLVTGSEKLKQDYAKHYGLKLKNIKVMPNWVNLERFNISSTSRERSEIISSKNILFVHRLSKRKGADKIVPIAKFLINLKSRTLNFKLLIIGDGPYREKLLSEIEENNLEKIIQLIGKIPNKELMKYYAKADLFIMPSLQEGFPRVLLEAMAMGVPYVASDVGAVREISPKIAQGFITKPGNVKDFAQKINLLLLDKKLYDGFRKEELKTAKKYALNKAIDKFVKLFQ